MREPIKSYEEWDIFDMKEGCFSELDVRKLEADYTELWKKYHMSQSTINNRESIIKKLEAENVELKNQRDELLIALKQARKIINEGTANLKKLSESAAVLLTRVNPKIKDLGTIEFDDELGE